MTSKAFIALLFLILALPLGAQSFVSSSFIDSLPVTPSVKADVFTLLQEAQSDLLNCNQEIEVYSAVLEYQRMLAVPDSLAFAEAQGKLFDWTQQREWVKLQFQMNAMTLLGSDVFDTFMNQKHAELTAMEMFLFGSDSWESFSIFSEGEFFDTAPFDPPTFSLDDYLIGN